ncbi:2',3'-cyclic-nucleotide 2'-phosphodiesterase [Fusobacterium animalis]|uniref:2',3'-cyclic-nucleotide 2'-phosphodiesterase n=1 Tax=Fusobacterium animalis TaxID=76859 RepID=A0A2G9F3J5_9FUSO|nr:RNA ligase [Fusobacterium animalis]PIM87461.1 2',3'-cyclic-nucleotide 2'-phosphodiesterase [Fusobacterium animalis]PIM87581.1 2',3'-cyclic-nucleotide 2'-phosphodiesterase [Fusobacterium animalis]
MRTLLLLRGAQASGKSTWVTENNLEPYTLSADKIRLNIANPVLNEDGSIEISQKYNKLTWELLYKYLEMRMENGDFTIIDATHSDIKLMNKYRDLANIYKYTIYYLEFDTPLEECLKRNRERIGYKYVPEKVIEKTWEAIKNKEKLPNIFKKINSIDEIINFYTADVNEYKKVIIIGDIHSCAEPLKEVLKDFSEENLYVFVGDYFDRGIQAVETFKIMLDLLEKPNVVLIEGNHENNSVKKFINDEEKYTKSFDETTLQPLLKEFELEYIKAGLKKIYKRLRQCYAFEFSGKKFLCTHGGLPLVPKLALVSAREMIKGVGKYETEIGEIYSENYKKGLCQDFIQVHGHRGINDGEYSYCLEGRVEFGGELKVLTIDNDGNIEKYGIKNDVYNRGLKLPMSGVTEKVEKFNTANELINEMIGHKFITVKECDYNLISLNFNREAFNKKKWNDLTIKARGLFVDRDSGEVKIRSYNKFFNFGERHVNLGYLHKYATYPIRVFKKYNGFLGLASVIDGNIVLASKSVTSGKYKDIFQSIWDKVEDSVKELLKQIMIENNCTAVFEVVSPEYDPHIIKYDKEHLYLLDFIENKLDIDTHNIDLEFSENLMKKVEFSSTILTKKELVTKLENYDELYNFLDEKAKSLEEFEGYVLCDNSGLMFKFKLPYYMLWKGRRTWLERYRAALLKGKKIEIKDIEKDENRHFKKFLLKLGKDKLQGLSIIDVREMYEESL